ncbi:MAG: cupin domain-containing protein [Candidatus Limnocylindria bacterium]
MDVELRRHDGPADPALIERALRAEASGVHGWSNGPGDTYAEHDHPFTKVLYCVRGSIEFRLADGRSYALRPGDRLVLPPRTRHSAVVGPPGCACIEGQGPPRGAGGATSGGS